MTTTEMLVIARRAAMLATDGNTDDVFDYYREYMDQLRTGDYQCLRQWIGYMVEDGDQEAAEIMKLLIRARLHKAA